MKKIKKIIIIALILLLILIVVIIKLNKKNLIKEEDNLSDIKTEENIINQVDSYTQYYTIINTIALYYGVVGQKDEEAISNMLYKEYANDKTIQEEIQKINSPNPVFYAKQMYVQTNDELYIYYVYGKVKNYLDSEESMDSYLQVYIDEKESTYAILPIDKQIYESAVLEGKLSTLSSIDKNDDNEFSYVPVSDITKATLIFNNYKQIMNEDIEEAYKLLNDEYSKIKFSDIDEYKKYIEKKGLSNSLIKEFNIQEYPDYTEYTCRDQNSNYYIFREDNVMNYSVLLDNYTLDSYEFIEKYNSCKTQERVILNIEKIKQALNSSDYAYVYGKLADSFKNNKYKTQEELENYIKNTLYNNIEIEYKKFNNEGETYIYDIVVRDSTNESSEEINMQIIMKLKEERDFVMSFSIK